MTTHVRGHPSARSLVRNTVLFVSISGWTGGPGRSLLTLLAHLPPGVRRVVASPRNGDLLSMGEARSLIDERVPIVRRRGQVPDIGGRFLAAAQIVSWVMRNRRHLLAIHANGSTELHLAAPAALLSGVPLTAWVHGYEAGRWDRWLGPVWRRVLPNARLVAVSDVARRVACEGGLATPDRIRIIPNPVDPADVGRESASVSRWAHRSAEAGGIVIGYLGSSSRDKGFCLLPDIIDGVSNGRVTWALFLSRPMETPRQDEQVWARLDALAQNGRVAFLGRKSEVREAYQHCDVVICPSLRESFSRIAAEAMVNGLPVVASDIEPLRDLVDDEAGILFTPGDTAAAAAAVERIAADPRLRAKLGEGGRQRSAVFAPGPIAEWFCALYRRRSFGLAGRS